jgi:Fe-S-cluster containining protein
MTIPFQRSICACEADRHQCRVHPGFLIPSDIPRIVAHVSAQRGEPAEVLTLLSPSRGFVLRERESQKITRLPTIIPMRKPDGSCMFLDAQERCTIHEVAPFGCAYFDMHESRADSDPKVVWGINQIHRSKPYAALHALLRKTQPLADPLETKGPNGCLPSE